MTTSAARDWLRELCAPLGTGLHRAAANQLHFLVQDRTMLLEMSRRLREEDYYLVTVVANDERELEDRCFKIYYLFSHPSEDLFLIVENALKPGAETYPSIYAFFPAAEPFEREIADLYGLFPDQQRERISHCTYLHPCYPADLRPLRRDSATRQAIQNLRDGDWTGPLQSVDTTTRQLPYNGELLLPVGPIHAGVIEPGHFLFRTSGEIIEGLEIRLGYTHKGIEHLFQTTCTLQDGWRLAEHIAGDSSFAHSLAYCQAAEALAGVRLRREAELLRGVFLELERMANHVGDTAALAHDLALEIAASDLAVLREELLRLNQRLAGHRLLRGLNRPGGLILPRALDVRDVRDTVRRIAPTYGALARLLAELIDFRERVIGVGVLSKEQASESGMTGLVARASGLDRDFRSGHPFGPYADSAVRGILRGDQPEPSAANRQRNAGDVFSRFHIRVREVESSTALIEHFLDSWDNLGVSNEADFTNSIDFSRVPNFEFGIGYSEGWRGDIVYWLMKDKFERIYRCKVRDPSTLNWPGLRAAVEPRKEGGEWVETLVADFPIINKSFNLSYSGNDL